MHNYFIYKTLLKTNQNNMVIDYDYRVAHFLYNFYTMCIDIFSYFLEKER